MLRGPKIVLAVALMAFCLHASSADAALPGQFHECGDLVTESSRMLNNLVCSGSTGGLQISGAGVTLDLDGHRITGQTGATGIGVTINAESEGATVRNGVISGFDSGVSVFADDATVSGLIVKDGDAQTVLLQGDRGRVVRNTLVGGPGDVVQAGLPALPSDDNLIRGNTILGRGGPGVSVQASEGNRVIGNRILGAGVGVFVEDGSDGTVVSENHVTGSRSGLFSGAGIHTFDAHRTAASDNVLVGNNIGILLTGDGNRVVGNVASANAGDGVVVADGDGSLVRENVVIGNRDDGVIVHDESSNLRIVRNRMNENGGDGIETEGAATPEIDDNTLNFNGYINGIDDTLGAGIISAAATGSGNKAKGSDAALQCPPGMCDVTAVPPPALVPCGSLLDTGLTLRHPMDCGSDALRIDADDVDLDLGSHFLSAGTGAGNSVLETTGGSVDGAIIRGGVIANATNGIALNGGLAHRIVGSTIVGNDIGVVATTVGPQPGVVGPRGRIDRNTLIANLAALVAVETSKMHVTSNIFAVNTAAISWLRYSIQNVLAANKILGTTNDALVADNVNDPDGGFDRSTLQGNTVAANNGNGVVLFNATDNLLSKNVIRGNGTADGSLHGLRLAGDEDAGGEPGGSQFTRVSDNVIQANSGDGIKVADESRNSTISGNRVSRNMLVGIAFDPSTSMNKLKANRVVRNVSHGILIPASGNVSVFAGNVASQNGFRGDSTPVPPVDDDIGLGVSAVSGTPGENNTAEGNDDPIECNPAPPAPPCG